MGSISAGMLIDHYRLGDELGAGGMGVVYRARDLDLDRETALKMVHAELADDQFLSLFQAEARVLAKINSPRIIQIYDSGDSDSGPYIVTQYIAGGDLTAAIRSRGTLPPHLACLVTGQVCEALYDAHRAGIIHQDVKPSNVLLQDPMNSLDANAYLCDFGIASSAAGSESWSVTGTWTYLAPECALATRENPVIPHPTRDVYAAGCMLWTALTGRPPYSGTTEQIAMAHQVSPIPQFAGDDLWTKEANRVLSLAMAKNPDARYQTADAFKKDLLNLRLLEAPAMLQPYGRDPIPVMARVPPATGETITIQEEAKPSKITAPRLIAAVGVVAVLGVGGGLGITKPWVDDGPKPIVPTVKGAAVADVNGDKFGDVVTNVPAEDGNGVDVVTWKSDGRTLTPSEPVLANNAGMDAEAPDIDAFPLVGDFEGKGRNSLLTLTRTENGWATTGAFKTEIQPPSLKAQNAKMKGLPFYYDFGVADGDGDGDTDLYLTVSYGDQNKTYADAGRLSGDGYVFVYHNTEGGFTAPTLFSTYPAADVERIAIGDFNGDNKADLAVLNRVHAWPRDAVVTYGKSTLSVYPGNGTLAEARRDVTLDHQAVASMVAGDVDGDGSDELVMTGFASRGGGDAITVGNWQSDWSGFKVAHRGNLPASYDSRDEHPRSLVTLSDLNGDGLTDIVALVRTTASGDYRFYGAVAHKSGGTFTGSYFATWKDAPDLVHGYDLMGSNLQ